jgi:hypothetical protein
MVLEGNFSDAVLHKRGNNTTPIVLGFVATADAKVMRAHIEKTPGYHMDLHSADEGWVIHFTCEDGFSPLWQTRDELRRGVNVIHVSYRGRLQKPHTSYLLEVLIPILF